jgi:glycosyltransferase involved in cell wall biosynthesis
LPLIRTPHTKAPLHTFTSCEHAPLLLLTLKSNQEPIRTSAIHQYVFESDEQNVLKRATEFIHWVKTILDQQYNLMLGHFRDIWGGMALLEFPHIRTVFEVNGLPSIELPYRAPYLSDEALEKIARMEAHCLQKANRVITPSYTTQRCLALRGCSERKITVIPNGATIPEPLPRLQHMPARYMVYAGALQPWQGVDVLLKSMRYLQDVDIPLVICSSYTEHHAKPFRKFAEKLEVAGKVIWLYQLGKPELYSVLQHALFSVAPLTECSRNVEQGCSPLKILESMACGTPVIASQLPPVEELIVHNEDGILVRPDRPAEMARAIRLAVEYPGHTQQLGERAKEKIEQYYTMHYAHELLRSVYDNIFTFSH